MKVLPSSSFRIGGADGKTLLEIRAAQIQKTHKTHLYCSDKLLLSSSKMSNMAGHEEQYYMYIIMEFFFPAAERTLVSILNMLLALSAHAERVIVVRLSTILTFIPGFQIWLTSIH